LSSVDGMRLTVLVDDSANPQRPELIAKHGLSFFVELKTGGHTTNLLMDTGPSADIVLKNALELGVDLKKIDSIVISHGHYDHTGGLLGVIKYIDKEVPVILHPEALKPKFVTKKKKLKKVGIPFLISELQKSNGILNLSKGPSSIVPGVWTSGEIRRFSQLERVKSFKVKEGGKIIEDQMLDDQALFVDVRDKGVVVVSGCAHAGLINIIKQAQKVSGSSCIRGVVGGFHLSNASAIRIKATIEELRKASVKSLMPCHCTGKNAVTKFVEVFGENCQKLGTGDSVLF
jgi:7,8-dihydropterin-6-yl-methyl-4-(beta-D-ribofuranosyl)aminobenzene 5'-phosphate synthase